MKRFYSCGISTISKISTFALAVIIVLSLSFFSACEEKDNTECSFKNPVTDLPWLKTKVTELSQSPFHARIYQCTYQTNKICFMVEPCVDCPDAGYTFYSCEGVELCSEGTIVGGYQCEGLNIDRDNKILIYEQNKPMEE